MLHFSDLIQSSISEVTATALDGEQFTDAVNFATRTDTLSPRRRVRFRSVAVGLAIASAVASCDPGSSEDEVDIARGAELYEANCISCHGGATGGEISDVPPRHNAEGHTWHHADCDLVDIVRDGLPRRTGYPEMPAFGDRLTDDEIRSILAHIKSWWEPDQREFQEQVTEQTCS